jgi:hypothetical protein
MRAERNTVYIRARTLTNMDSLASVNLVVELQLLKSCQMLEAEKLDLI